MEAGEGARFDHRIARERSISTYAAPRRAGAGLRRLALATALIATLAGGLAATPAGAVTLPDHRVYELAMRDEVDGHEVDMNGVQGNYGFASRDGNALDWRAIGGCCGATSAAQETYQSYRGEKGWRTKSLTPVPSNEDGSTLAGLFGGEAPNPRFTSPDLQQTIFSVPKIFPPGTIHPYSQNDLYLEGPTGELTWVSRGPTGSGTELWGATFDGATPDAGKIVFSSSEALTADATGLTPRGPESQYLYLRDVAAGTTTLVAVDDAGALLGAEGAVLGDAGYLGGGLLPVNNYGTNTNAISLDGSKLFFETPPPSYGRVDLGSGSSHLYMRDLDAGTTTPLDEPGLPGWARYEGAAEDGSLVYFTSNEGLGGAPAVPELYVFNTTAAAIGPVPSMTAVPISTGNPGTPGSAAGVTGMTAIANDGSRAFFVSAGILAANQNATGATAVAGQPNLYAYDLPTGAASFIATLGPLDVSECQPSCGAGRPSFLIGEPDLSRRAFPTPDGSALVFESFGDLTGEAPGPSTHLTAPVASGEHQLQVESTAGMAPKQMIVIGSGAAAESEEIATINSPTELTIAEFDDNFAYGVVGEFAAGEAVVRPAVEAYRYLADGELNCLSCPPAGVVPAATPTLGLTSGGTYMPQGQNVPMNEDASQVFFQSANVLTPEASPAPVGKENEATHVYEWEGGKVSLISDGSSSGSALDGTTPSGDDVFFSTRSRLTDGDTGNWINVYDARVDGGFPTPPVAPEPCVGQACRGAVAPPPTFEVPASSLGATEDGGAGLDRGGFTVLPLDAVQRRQLARSGSVTVKVRTTAPGTVTATLRTSIDGRDVTAARGSATPAGGMAAVKLTLSPAARRALAAGKTLALRLDVSFSGGGRPVTSYLTLRASSPAGRGSHAG